VILKYETNSAPMCGESVKWFIAPQDLSTRRLESGYCAQESGLPASGCTKDRKGGSLLYLKINSTDGSNFAVTETEVAQA
jgi:hypothetical protein